MKLISTRTQGYLHYVTGMFLILIPRKPGFANAGIATWLALCLRLDIIIYSLASKTKPQSGRRKVFPPGARGISVRIT